MTATNFESCLAFVLKFEGGNVDDLHDSGGRTSRGVTQVVYDGWRHRNGLPHRDVYTMITSELADIYRVEYWAKINGDTLRSGEDLAVFDFAVNSGPARALTFWKQAGGRGKPVAEVIHAICAHRLSFLHALGSWKRFGRGWGARVAACEALALRLAYGHDAAPSVLTASASKAASKSDNLGSVAAVIAGGALISPALTSGHQLVAVAATAAAGAGVSAFKAWRNSQRADALTAAAKA